MSLEESTQQDPSLVYGESITATPCKIDFNAYGEIPDPRCSTVSFVKRDGFDHTCRNVVAVSEKYICYAVRGNLLRVIETGLGKKVLLRGHESHVMDLKFSCVRNNTLCSVDSGSGDSQPHIWIWEITDSDELSHSCVSNFSFPASLVQPHPINSSVWAISHASSIGIISTTTQSNGQISSFEDLPLHANVTGQVEDLSFSADGGFVVAVCKQGALSQVLIMAISMDLSAGEGSLSIVRRVTVPNLSSAQCISVGGMTSLVTTTKGTMVSSSGNGVSVEVSVWRWDRLVGSQGVVGARDSPALSSATQEDRIQQRVIVVLPLSKKGVVDGAVRREGEEERSTSLVLSSPDGKYLVLSDRRSYAVCCLAITPLLSEANSTSLLLYHGTLLDLKMPVWSAAANIISDRDHHSDSDVENLEINCFQEQDSAQSAVQQYNIPWVQVFGAFPPSHSLISSSPASDAALHQLPNTTSITTTAPSDLLKETSAITPPPLIAITPLSSSSSPSVSRLGANSPLDTKVSAGPPVPVISAAQLLLKSSLGIGLQASTSSSTKASQSLSSSDPVYTPPSSSPAPHAPSGSARVSHLLGTLPSTSNPLSFLIEAKETPAATGSSVSLKKVTNAQDSTLSPDVEDDFASGDLSNVEGNDGWDNAVKLSQSMLGMSVDPSISTPSVSPPPKDVVDSKEADPQLKEGKAKERSGNSRSNGDSQGETADRRGGDTNDLEIVLTQLHSSISSLEKKSLTQNQLNNLKSDLLSAFRGLEKKQADLQKDSHDKLLKKQQELLQEKGNIHKTVQGIFDKKWSDELAKSMSESVAASLAPPLSNSVKDEVQSAVANTLKQSLNKAFRKAFEGSLLPAFQAGTDRMFAQIESAFDNGLDRLLDQNRMLLKEMEVNMAKPYEEMKQLRQDIDKISGKLDQALSNIQTQLSKHEDLIRNNVVPKHGPDITEYEDNPLALLEQKRLREAVELAVEKKSPSELVSLLQLVRPEEVIEQCDSLCVMCIAQQLAADFASLPDGAEPIEGTSVRMMWLKEILMECDNFNISEKDAQNDLFGHIVKSIARIEEKLLGTAWKTDLKMLKKAASRG